MRRTILTVARAISAALALMALLVGLPVALAALAGWPLPTRVPTLQQLTEALSGSTISDATLIKGIAVVCWLAWAQLAACILVEAYAWARGRAAARLPGGGLLQPLARQLVLTAVVLLPSGRPTLAAPVLIKAVPVVQTYPLDVSDQQTGPIATPGTAASDLAVSVPASPAPTCTVRPRDSLWRLAERHLGNGYRWREVFDLNQGVRQADGRSLQEPDIIRAGWVLTLPPDAVGLGRAAAEEPSPPATPPPTETPLTAAEASEAPAPLAASPAAPEAPAPSAVSLAAPEPPAPPTAGPIDPPLVSGPRDPATPAPTSPQESPGSHAGSADSTASRTSHDDGEVPVATLARIGLMATGVVVTIDRLRRVQQRRRRGGRAIPVPAGPAAETERCLRAAAAGSPADRLDVALRSLSTHLAERCSGPALAIEAVSVSDEAIEILLTEAATADPGPFVVTAEGRSWTLPADVEVSAATVQRPAPAPLLALVGIVEERQVLVDLEARPTTALTGEPEAAAGLFASLTLGLATSRWADDLSVVLIGRIHNGIDVLERMRVVDTVDEVIEDLEAESRALSAELSVSGATSTFEARLAQTPDGWVPTVVLVDNPADPSLARLLRLADETHGLAVVVLGPPPVPVAREITIADGSVRVTPPGLRLEALGVTAGQIESAAEVIDVAGSHEEGEAIIPGAPEAEPATGLSAARHGPILLAPPGTEPPEVEVRVLGAPEIVGGKEPIDRRKSKELVVYLALHPRGSDEGRLKAALWPGQVPTPGTFNQTVSKARVSLGCAADGSHHLPHVADGLYRLGPQVAVDVHRLEAAFAAATIRASDGVIEDLAAALGAVRGVPFEGAGAGYEWAHTEGLIARIEAIAADAALLLAEWFLDRRDTARSLWAASQGLLASPGDERLFRVRMQAHDLAGNPAGVESVMEELCHVVEALEPYDELHPETLALYEELKRRGRRTG